MYLFKILLPNQLQIVPYKELFGLFERVNTEGGKHLARDQFFGDLKSQYIGFISSKEQEISRKLCEPTIQILFSVLRSFNQVNCGEVA